MQFDLTRPNSGRMYDYWLGGDHNFEIDRHLADQISAKLPLLPTLTLEARALIRTTVEYFHAHGIRAIIDFGSSLPTCDNTHLIARELDPAIKVVYSDIDPITAVYGKELVKGLPSVIYLQADAANPCNVLDAAETLALLGDERRVGFIFDNLAHAMPDEQVKNAWRILYDWASPGSYLAAIVASEHWEFEPDLIEVLKVYQTANLSGFFRTPAELVELALPWQVTAEGVLPNTVWRIPRAGVPTRVTAYSLVAAKLS